MRILIISDTHTDSIEKLPGTVIEEIKKANKVIHAGDIDNYNLINEILKLNSEVYPVKGNMDSYPDPQLLPTQRIIKIHSFTIGIIHGDGSPNNLFNRLLYNFPEQDIIIFGHTHRPCKEYFEDKLLINPGSVLNNRGLNMNSYAILNIDENGFDADIHFIPK